MKHIPPKQINAENLMKPCSQVYQDIINSDEGGPRHSIYTPRDYKQVMHVRVQS